MPTDAEAREVLRRYPAEFARATLTPLGNAGGFSGARVWRVEHNSDAWCLKAWPTTGPSPARLAAIHRRMQAARRAGLSFVPLVCATRDHASHVEEASRLWDLQTWMPGTPDARPPAERIASASAALAMLHRAWVEETQEVRICPAIARRVEAFQQWTTLRHAVAPNRDSPSKDLTALARDAWAILSQQMDRIPGLLAPWAERPVFVQPCLCDIWHAHVFFEAERVTGIIDFGSVKLDHVAVDLARLLGSIAGDNAAAWHAGLEAYQRLRPIAAEDVALAHVLDRTGVLVGLFNWLKWLYHERRMYDNPAAVAARLGELVHRAQSW